MRSVDAFPIGKGAFPIECKSLPECISKNRTGNTTPFTQTTHYLKTVTQCILDTELYMKVVQKEVANVSNPIARIVPSTVAAESSGNAMKRCFPVFSWNNDQNKPRCRDFLHCYYRNYALRKHQVERG